MSNIPCTECGQEEMDCTCHCPYCHERWERCICKPDFDDGDIEDIVDEGLDGWDGE